jgi:hypothetical protein
MSIAVLSGGKGLKTEFSRRQTGLGVAGLLKSAPKSTKISEANVKVKIKSTDSISTSKEVGKQEVLEEDGDVELQFTVFENQRWWVGLDWTHALLPGERASWCVSCYI